MFNTIPNHMHLLLDSDFLMPTLEGEQSAVWKRARQKQDGFLGIT